MICIHFEPFLLSVEAMKGLRDTASPLQKELYIRRMRQPPFLDNSLITIWLASSSSSQGQAILAWPSITLPMDYKCAILFNVNHVHLYAFSILGHDLKSCLPISRSAGVMRLFHVH